MKRTPKYCKQKNRDLGFYYLNGRKIYLPGGYNSVLSLVAYHRAMIDYRIELEKIVNQVAQNELDNLALTLQHEADKFSLALKQKTDNLGRVAESLPNKSESPSVVYIGNGSSYQISGNNAELVEAIQEGCNETGLAAILSKMANADNTPPSEPVSQVTVRTLYEQFMAWAKTSYPNKKQTQDDYRKSCKVLLELYGDTSVSNFGRKELIDVQSHLESSGKSITTCNDYLVRMRVVFNWGAERAIIDYKIADELGWVKKLEKGRTTAPEAVPREDVPDDVVNATLPFLPQMISDMVQIQRETAMRPSEVFRMTWAQIDTTDDIWVYEPQEYKERRHVDYKPVALTPLCQQLLERYKDTPPHDCIFSKRRNAKEMGKKNIRQ